MTEAQAPSPPALAPTQRAETILRTTVREQ
jgi:hypothetical protein